MPCSLGRSGDVATGAGGAGTATGADTVSTGWAVSGSDGADTMLCTVRCAAAQPMKKIAAKTRMMMMAGTSQTARGEDSLWAAGWSGGSEPGGGRGGACRACFSASLIRLMYEYCLLY